MLGRTRVHIVDIVKGLVTRVGSLEGSLTDLRNELADVRADMYEIRQAVSQMDEMVQILRRIYGLILWVSRTAGAAFVGVVIKTLFDHLHR